jgi:formate dehydrogenase major subunit
MERSMNNKFLLNGKETPFKQGQTVLQAAKANGIYIPSLCYHDKTGVAGKCRNCQGETPYSEISKVKTKK